MPVWLELSIGLSLVVLGVWKGYFGKMDEVGSDTELTKSFLWVLLVLIPGILPTVHSIGRMFFGW